MPGVKREDVNIEVSGRELTISGRFEFRVALPSEVNPEGVDAKLNEGVLTVRVPKAERAQRRRIEVKSA